MKSTNSWTQHEYIFIKYSLQQSCRLFPDSAGSWGEGVTANVVVDVAAVAVVVAAAAASAAAAAF
jgi:hypothetical protein